MKHLKHHPINDKQANLSDDMKEQDHVNPPAKKKLDADKSLSDPAVSSKYSKPSNKNLDGEDFLSDYTKVNMKHTKPSNKKLDGENFLSEEVASTVKLHPVNDKSQKLSKDMKKQNFTKFSKKDKKLKPEKSLQEVSVPTKKAKANNEPLRAEKSLSTDGGKIKKFNQI